MPTLAVTTRGQVTLRRDLLQHLGISPGERINFDKLPNGEIRLKAASPDGTIEPFIGRHAGKVKKVITLAEINEVSEKGWAGEK